MKCVLLAESAVLVHLQSVGTVFLVLHCVVVSLLAFCARQSDFNSHFFHPFRIIPSGKAARFFLFVAFVFWSTQIKPLFRGNDILSQIK